MKTPTKAELYAQIEALERENIKLREELDAEKERRWLEHKREAIAALFDSVPFTVLQIWNLVLDHVDNTGYWFTFNVDNRLGQKQTYCVRHTDLEGKYHN